MNSKSGPKHSHSAASLSIHGATVVTPFGQLCSSSLICGTRHSWSIAESQRGAIPTTQERTGGRQARRQPTRAVFPSRGSHQRSGRTFVPYVALYCR
eukprot:scaffold2675_cov398-Prasinococcus_capsulatus_cf.AAC.7